MNRPLAALTAIAVLGAAAPALAQTTFEMRADLEYQNWNWASPSGGSAWTYATPMTTFTILDHSGAIFGAVSTVARNESSRMAAESEAIRKGDRSYTYQVEEARAREGTKFGFSVGQGGLLGAARSGTGAPDITGQVATSRMARIYLGGDIVELFGGVLTFDSGVAYWSALTTTAAGAKAVDIEAWNWPLGLSYRYAPSFLPGLVITPHANFDWLITLAGGVNGRWNMDGRNFGLEAAYHVLPELKVRAAHSINRLGHNAVPWMKNEEMVDMQQTTLGVTMLF